MTPVEIFEYKNKWKPGFTVRLHSDLRLQGKDYCRKQLQNYQWAFKIYTNVYEDTFYFEAEKEAAAFKKHFGRFADQEVL